MAEKRPLLDSIDEGAMAPQDFAPSPSRSDMPPMDHSAAEKPMGAHKTSYVVYSLMFLEGIGSLFPWNAFITVTQYFANRLEGSPFEDNFINYFTFSFQLVNIIFLLLEMRYKQRISIHTRIIVPLVCQFVIFAVMLALTKVHVVRTPFFAVTLALVICSGAATAFLQGGVFGLAAVLPHQYMGALMTGQGLGGLVVAVLNVVSLAANGGSSNVVAAAFMFFIISVVILLGCLVGYFYLMKHPLVVHHLEYAEEHRKEQLSQMSVNTQGKNRRRSYLVSESDIQSTFSKVKWPSIWVMLVFTVTLAIFPGLAVEVVSATPKSTWGSTYFVPVYVFVLFNLGDTLGRYLVAHFKWPSFAHYRWLRFPVYLRAVFIVLFIFCNLNVSKTHDTISPVAFVSDAWPIIFMLAMAVSNGYFGTLCMTYGPKLVREGEMEAAGSIMVLFLTVGLLLGSLTSFAINGILCECNPFASS